MPSPLSQAPAASRVSAGDGEPKADAAGQLVACEQKPINFCLLIRLECKDGVKKCIRIPYKAGDFYASIKHDILEKYLPEEAKPFDASKHVVKLREINDDAGWNIDIDTTEELELAVSTALGNSQSFLKMSAFIRKKSDPPIVLLDLDAASDPSAMVTVGESVVAAAGVTAGEKRKKAATLQKKLPTAKRRKVGKSVASTAAGGNKIPVRARIIGALAELRALGKTNPPRIQVAIFAGYSNSASKGFANPLSALKTEDIVAYPDKKSVALTAKGLETQEAKGVTPPKDNEEVHARIKALLTPKQQQIFDLLAADGGAHPRDGAAAAVGYSNPASKGWSNSIGKMSSLGLVHYPRDESDPKRKLIQLTDMCFPFSKQRANDVPFVAFHAAAPPPPTSSTSFDDLTAPGDTHISV